MKHSKEFEGDMTLFSAAYVSGFIVILQYTHREVVTALSMKDGPLKMVKK
jgi:hypothetical protein